MTVIVASDTPNAIRGMLKRWFIEPQAPNVFVGTSQPCRTHEKTIAYIKRSSTAAELGLLLIVSLATQIARVTEST